MYKVHELLEWNHTEDYYKPGLVYNFKGKMRSWEEKWSS